MSLYDPTPIKHEYVYETKTQAKKPTNDGTYKTSNDKRHDPEYNWHMVEKNNANSVMNGRRRSTRKRGISVWRRATGIKETNNHKKHTRRVNRGLARLMRGTTFFKEKSSRSHNSLNSPKSLNSLNKLMNKMGSLTVGPKKKTRKKKRVNPY